MSTSKRPPASGLFRRIYLTFVGTVIVFAALSALVVLVASSRFDDAWVADVDEGFEAIEPDLLAHLDDPDALDRDLRRMAERYDLRLGLRSPRGTFLAGTRDLPPPPRRRRLHRLENGKPVIMRGPRFAPPILHWGIRSSEPGRHPDQGRLVAVLTADAGAPGRFRWVVGGTVLGLLVMLGLGALPLARSLVRRLAAVENGAEQIADGALSHRLPLPPGGPRDEVDGLAATFNRMAERLERLVSGQQILLANVSHELRTPVARMRVLVEILEERVELLGRRTGDAEAPLVGRLSRGLGELTEDLQEIQALIGDLLTSGKLELAADGGVDRAPLVAAELTERLADRFSAVGSAEPPELVLQGDPMLLERLLSNLLSNARRACPDGEITLRAAAQADGGVIFTVEDEGPGIPLADRETIFEPFSRLDGARDRDQGGVGLGLYLCRQIARAHGGTIITEDRPDGASGARFVITLPAVQPAKGPTARASASSEAPAALA